jgi:hypothetical protein
MKPMQYQGIFLASLPKRSFKSDEKRVSPTGLSQISLPLVTVKVKG